MTARSTTGSSPYSAAATIDRTHTGTAAPPTTVREARPEEAAAVAALVRDGYLDYADAVPSELLRAWLDDVVDPSGGVTFVAIADGTLAGTARLHLGSTYPVPLPASSAGVRAVVVAPAHRRAGVGNLLMAACLERARTAGAAALYVHTAPFMTAALALYEGLGYRRDPSVDLDVGAHFGVASAGEMMVAAYRLDLAPACRILRGGEGYEGRQGLSYAAGISTESAGARGLCLHTLTIPPGGRAKAHRHESHESAIYTVSGRCEVWWGDGLAHHDEVGPGDFVYIPAGVPHLPVNRTDEPLFAVIARTDPNEQESVVLMPELDAVPDQGTS